MSNPWYEVVGPDVRLTQGDIILECPLLKWQLDDAAEGEVDFHSVHTMPRAFLDTLIYERGAKKLRLLPPYREHLS